MSQPGRKLTIRMPDNPHLREAGIGGIHVDPGGRVAKGAPVMTLVSRRSSNIVRSPRSGRVLPMVSEEDRVIAGDPLFILHLDEAALAEEIRDRASPMPVDKGDGPTPASDEIAPMIRGAGGPDGFLGFVATWGRPVLALSLYVLACFVLLPLLHVFGDGAPIWQLALMTLGIVAFAVLVFRLYTPGAGTAPKLAVATMSISWVGLAAVALFLRPDVQGDVTVAGLSDRMTQIFRPGAAAGDADAERPNPSSGQASTSDTAVAETASGAAPAPTDVESAAVGLTGQSLPVAAPGVTGGDLGLPVRPPSAPVTVLADLSPAPAAHGVTVRPWARVRPGREPGSAPIPGEPLAIVPAAIFPADQSAATQALALGQPTQTAPLVPGPAGSAPVLVVEQQRPLRAVRLALSSGSPTAGTIPSRGEPTDLAPATPQAADLALASDAGTPAALPRPSDGPVMVSSLAVLLDRAAPDLEWSDGRSVADVQVAAVDPTLGRDLPGARLIANPGIDPVRLFARHAGEDGWIGVQVAVLNQTVPPATPGRSMTGAVPRTTTAQLPVPAGLQGRPSAPVVIQIRVASAIGDWPSMGAMTVPDPVALAAGLASQSGQMPGAAVPPSDAPRVVAAAALQQGALATQPALDAAPVMRELLYLYVDDPRRTRQPGLGDAWVPQVSPDLAQLLRGSRVVEVHPLIRVAGWCAAAVGATTGEAPDRAWLDDRVRLLRVRLWLEPDAVDALEIELPVFSGGQPGFFHNRMPLLGRDSADGLMAEGLDFVRQISNRFMDPHTPDGDGGHYFDTADALVQALRQVGCRRAVLNDGAPASGDLGRSALSLLGS
ncbi:MAG: hypothetical protein AAF674_12690 [Pseudomonadota bacterium]